MGGPVERLLELELEPVRQAVEPRDCQLYALSLGMVRDPEDPWALPFVLERGLQVFPTMATVLGRTADWMRWPELSFLGTRLLHGGQSLSVHRPMAVGETVVSRVRVVEVADKGEGRGALLVVERLIEGEAGDPIATLRWTVFCRGAGGFGGPSVLATPQPPPPPDRAPDATLELPVRADAALLYRLTGDMNPIHADPEAARAAGLDRPVLHGLQMYGAVAAEVLRWAGASPLELLTYDMRFSGLPYPGETLAVSAWREADELAIAVRAPGRGAAISDAARLTLKRRS